MSEPLATYVERLPQVKRTLRLFADRIEIDAAWTVGKDYHSTVQLADMTPQYKLLTTRNRWFRRSIMIGALAAAATVVFTRGDYPDWLKRNALLGWAVVILAAIMALRTYRTQQFARFTRKDGRPGLDIFRAGPDAAHFEEFLRDLQKKIRKA